MYAAEVIKAKESKHWAGLQPDCAAQLLAVGIHLQVPFLFYKQLGHRKKKPGILQKWHQCDAGHGNDTSKPDGATE